MIYELIHGSTPFTASTDMDRYKNIISGKIEFSTKCSVEVQDMISRLCMQDQSERMGRTKGGTKSVMQHLWFASFQWRSLIDKSMEAPFMPKVGTERKANNSLRKGVRANLSVYNKAGGIPSAHKSELLVRFIDLFFFLLAKQNLLIHF